MDRLYILDRELSSVRGFSRMDRDIVKIPVGNLPQHKIQELIAFLEDGNNI